MAWRALVVGGGPQYRVGGHRQLLLWARRLADEGYPVFRFDLCDIVQLEPTVDYRTALQEMLCADGLLLFQASVCNHQIPAKLYEYLRARPPIFALTDPRGNTADALRAVGVKDIVNIADTQDIAAGLLHYLDRIRTGSASGVPSGVAIRHSRRARTGELAELLNAVCPLPR